MSGPLSGARASLRAGGAVAEIASVGASLRALEVDGRPLVTTWDADAVRPLFRGATLVPWPNRVVDGRYAFDGAVRQQIRLHGTPLYVDMHKMGKAIKLSGLLR